MGQRHEAHDLGRIDHLVGDEDVVEAGLDHGLRFADRGTREARHRAAQLASRQFGGAMGLDVRSHGLARALQEGRHGRHVRLEDVEVDHERRRRQRRLDQWCGQDDVRHALAAAARASLSRRSAYRAPRALSGSNRRETRDVLGDGRRDRRVAARPDTGQDGRPPRARLLLGHDFDGQVADVGHQLEPPGVPGAAAGGPDQVQLDAARTEAFQAQRELAGDGFHQGPHDVDRRRREGHPGEGAAEARRRRDVRQRGEGRVGEDVPRIRPGLRESGLQLGDRQVHEVPGPVDDAHPVGIGDEDAEAGRPWVGEDVQAVVHELDRPAQADRHDVGVPRSRRPGPRHPIRRRPSRRRRRRCRRRRSR